MALVPFGKYKDRPVEDMLADGDYMAWLEAQPWFRDRFGHLLAGRDADAASRTPVHNRLQTLFLERPYRRAFIAAAGSLLASPDFHPAHCAVIFERSERYGGGSRHADVWFQEFTPLGDGFVQLEVWLEIKPVVADDYPAVIRQMRRNGSEYLFVDRYTGDGATEAQFVAMFRAGNLTVVFKRDVDALL